METYDNVIVSNNNKKDVFIEEVIEINKEKIELWWPHGYGDQNLYNIHVSFENMDNNDIKVLFILFFLLNIV